MKNLDVSKGQSVLTAMPSTTSDPPSGSLPDTSANTQESAEPDVDGGDRDDRPNDGSQDDLDSDGGGQPDRTGLAAADPPASLFRPPGCFRWPGGTGKDHINEK